MCICHGNDPCIDANGNDVYAEVKQMGMYRTIQRVTGISTTELIGRMLSYIREDKWNSDRWSANDPRLLSEVTESRWKFAPTAGVYMDFFEAGPGGRSSTCTSACSPCSRCGPWTMS